MGLERRLRKVEELLRLASLGGCPDCGLAPGEPPTEFEIVWDDAYPERSFARPRRSGNPDRCPTCTQQLTYCVEWLDLAMLYEPLGSDETREEE